jgi:AcrR family transcriptional regulator/DNA-binding MarR family transcriptional regulator
LSTRVTRAAGGRAPEREQIAEIQRARILDAMLAVVCDEGVGGVTVAHVVQRAGVSRRTFYENFSDGEQCFLAALDSALARASERVLSAHREPSRWSERIRAGLLELLELFDEDPALARMLVVESQAAGPRAHERRARALAALTAAVDAGRCQARANTGLTALTAEGAVGGALAVLHARLLSAPGRREPLSALANQLMSLIVLPYLGPAAARRELQRPIPRRPRRPAQAASTARRDPFKDAGIRLTYRTMRALSAIAEHPGCSNRQLSSLAEMSDQGQTSKLLGRLERQGLIANEGPGHARGVANAWTLTALGRKVANSVRTHQEAGRA